VNAGDGSVTICYDATASLQEFSSIGTTANVFPNPATNTLFVTFSTLLAPADVELLSILGEKIMATTLSARSTMLDISALSNGSMS
jgi:hypothetical protein